MMIEIDDDFKDEIVGAEMIQNYLMVKEFLKNEENSHPDDVASWKQLLPAIELVGNWYMTDFKGAVKKAKKGKK
jgi:hypothetical protein